VARRGLASKVAALSGGSSRWGHSALTRPLPSRTTPFRAGVTTRWQQNRRAIPVGLLVRWAQRRGTAAYASRLGTYLRMLKCSDLLVIAVCLVCTSCASSHCDLSLPWIPVVVPGGRASIESFTASGACAGQGSPSDCVVDPATCTDASLACACTIYTVHVTAPWTTLTCDIEVTSATGSVFRADVQVITTSSQGCLSAVANPSMIVVDFADAGSGDAATD
jgi:hypothetical protein